MGPQGHVVVVERIEAAVASARQLVAERGLSNVEVIHGDGRCTELERGSFDLATAASASRSGRAGIRTRETAHAA